MDRLHTVSEMCPFIGGSPPLFDAEKKKNNFVWSFLNAHCPIYRRFLLGWRRFLEFSTCRSGFDELQKLKFDRWSDWLKSHHWNHKTDYLTIYNHYWNTLWKVRDILKDEKHRDSKHLPLHKQSPNWKTLNSKTVITEFLFEDFTFSKQDNVYFISGF